MRGYKDESGRDFFTLRNMLERVPTAKGIICESRNRYLPVFSCNLRVLLYLYKNLKAYSMLPTTDQASVLCTQMQSLGVGRPYVTPGSSTAAHVCVCGLECACL